MSSLFNNLLVEPIYNVFVFLFNVPFLSGAGVATIVITILVRFALYPLSKKAVKAQIEMQKLAPELEALKVKHKDNQEEMARKTLALYKDRGVNPFAGIFVLLIQLPVVFALYHIFVSTSFPTIDTSLLYSFIQAPAEVSPFFLGSDLTEKSAIFALLAAIATYFQLKLAMPKTEKPASKEVSTNDLAKSMQGHMKYFFPPLVFFIAYSISGVVALYWLTTNLFTIAQEIVVRKKLA